MPAELSPHHAAPLGALEVARYSKDMTAKLEAMAIAAGLDVLAYFLGMARAEGDLFVRSNGQADDKGGQVGGSEHVA